MPTNKPQQSFFIMTHIVWELQRPMEWKWNEKARKERRQYPPCGRCWSLRTWPGRRGRGQICWGSSLGAHNISGSKDKRQETRVSSENIKVLRFLIGSSWQHHVAKVSLERFCSVDKLANCRYWFTAPALEKPWHTWSQPNLKLERHIYFTKWTTSVDAAGGLKSHQDLNWNHKN